MAMDAYSRYMRQKAFLDLYNNLSEEEKRSLAMHFSHLNNNVSTQDNAQLDCIEQAVTGSRKFFGGVGENVVGNAFYDIALRLFKNILRNIKL